MQNPEFFTPIILRLTNDSLASMFSKDPEENKKDIRKFMAYIEYCLFMYCKQNGAQMGWLGLHKEEQEEFENIYAAFTKRYKIDNFNSNTLFDSGNRRLNALISDLINNILGTYNVFGVI